MKTLMPEKWVVICCPVSGKKDGEAVIREQFLPKAKALGIDVTMELTKCVGHATELAKQYGSQGCGLVLVGGDGTIHEAIDGLVDIQGLDKVPLALLSQGTMNAYYHSARLPSVEALPKLMKKNSYRIHPLMRVKDSSGELDTVCFEAVYMGFTYHPAKGAQDFRKSFLGPFFGIMSNIIKCNLIPRTACSFGTLTMYPMDGSEKIVVEDDFFWLVVTQRNPYNAVLTEDEMWVSYITLKNYPGFGRMMNSFSPPMEFRSSLVNLMENHVCVKRFEFEERDPNGHTRMCLDGDPIEAGRKLEITHVPQAWNIIAEKEIPKNVAEKFIIPRPETECAKRWLSKNSVPDGLPIPKMPEQNTTGMSTMALAFIGGCMTAAAFAVYLNWYA